VSEHVREQLSPLLDGELPGSERAAVEAHLESCSECAGLLEDLAAVDTLARGLSVPAPEDGFESFPARVRARIAARPRRRTLPAWSWAAAAALLLGVVTPWTWIRLAHQAPTAQSEAAPAAVPAEPPASMPPTTLRDYAFAEPEKARRREASGPETKPAQTASRNETYRTDGVAAQEARRQAPRPGSLEASLERQERKIEAAASAGEAKPEPKPEELGTLGYVDAGSRRTAATPPAPPPPPPLAPPPQNAETDRLREREAGADARKADAPAPATAAPTAGAAPGRVRDSGVAFKRAAELQTEDELSRALAALASNTVESARKAREAWRTYVKARPEGSPVDNARVRMIEAGMTAWQLSREDRDREVVLRDIADYLDRRDARQAERVRIIRQRIEPR
jgi:hypothetical protein